MPPAPMTVLAEGAAQMHELYTAYIDAGFTPAQAMKLICALAAAAVAQQSQT